MSILLQKAGEYGKKTLRRKVRLLLSALITVVLFAISCHYLYSGINRRLFLVALLCLLTGAFLACPKPENSNLRLLSLFLYLAVVPYKLFQRMELPVHDMNSLRDSALWANILIILSVYAALLLVTQRFRFALGGGGIVLLVLSLLNYYANQSQGGYFRASDWSVLRTALPVLNSWQPAMSAELWYSILYFCFFIAFGFWCDAPVSSRKTKYHLTVTALSLACLLGFYCFFSISDYLEAHRLQSHPETIWADEYLNGFLLSFALDLGAPESSSEAEWYEKSPMVCHALGGTEDGIAGTNSLDALEYNYQLGHRVFEVDIAITSDNVAVLRHDWDSDLGQAESFGWTEEEQRVPTAKEFLETPIYESYTPMTLLQLYQIMEEREDMYVIIDPKYSHDVIWQFTILVNTALDNGCESVLERIIVQLYYEEMYAQVESVYHFDHYLYTLYYIGYPGAEQVGTFCEKNGIPVVVMPHGSAHDGACRDLKEYPVRVYVHTVDESDLAQTMVGEGVDGIYSDYLLPKEMKQWLLQGSQSP